MRYLGILLLRLEIDLEIAGALRLEISAFALVGALVLHRPSRSRVGSFGDRSFHRFV